MEFMLVVQSDKITSLRADNHPSVQSDLYSAVLPSKCSLSLSASRLCQCPNGPFPLPLACLCRSAKCVFVVGIYDARVLSDIRYFQKRLAAFVDGDCLELTESIAHKIYRGAFHRQCLCTFVGEDDGDRVE